MRLLTLLIAAFLLAAGPEAPALAGGTETQVRPGLILWAGDGRLTEMAQDRLDQAPDAEKKQLLTRMLGVASPSPYFNGGLTLNLCAQGWSRCGQGDSALPPAQAFQGPGLLMFFYLGRPPEINFSLLLTPDRAYEREELAEKLESAWAEILIDDLFIEAGHWRKMVWGEGEDHQMLLFPPALSGEDMQKFLAEVMTIYRGGRRAVVKIALSEDEIFTADFDLAGLDQALNLMAEKMAEVDRAVEAERRELRKQLEALN